MSAVANRNRAHGFQRGRGRYFRGIEGLEPRQLFSAGTYDFGTLASFTGKTGTGAQPQGLVMAPNGDMYGVTTVGGPKAYGSIFKVPAGTNTIVTLATFDGTDGAAPHGNLVLDSQGNLYGTTVSGGAHNDGTVFEFPAGTASVITTLVSFTGANGSFPLAGLVTDSNGNLFGTTAGLLNSDSNKGVVFEVTAGAHVFSVIATLPADSRPAGTVAFDAQGDIFSTTTRGGVLAKGTIFKIAAGTSTAVTLATFNSTNGAAPDGTLLSDAQGNLIGTAALGGTKGAGTIFKLFATSSTITTLATFNFTNGNRPIGTLIMDSGGNIFGSTALGGGNAGGVVYELPANSGTISVLHAFSPQINGLSPTGPLVMDSDGDLIGATYHGGTLNLGALFELLPTGSAQKPVQLVFTQAPANAVAGQAIAPAIVVKIEDVLGNVVTSDNDDVTLTLASGPTTSTLSGMVSLAAVNGVATFSGISIDQASSYTMTASDGVRTSAPSKAFTIAPDAASAQLEFFQQPMAAATTAEISPPVVVKVVDNFGNVVTSNNEKITLAISTGPGGAVLSGTLSFIAVKGTATFSDLALNLVGTYQLSAAAAGLTTVTSDPFMIT